VVRRRGRGDGVDGVRGQSEGQRASEEGESARY
jgi:hypothetical protein